MKLKQSKHEIRGYHIQNVLSSQESLENKGFRKIAFKFLLCYLISLTRAG
jgi:hypothetical protein